MSTNTLDRVDPRAVDLALAQSNADVVELVSPIAKRAAAGSFERRVYGCVLVAFSSTKSVAHARRTLDLLTDKELRAACHELADKITGRSTT